MAHSRYGGGAEPRTSETFVCSPTPAAIQCTTRSTRPDGRTVVASFTAPDNGSAGPVLGIAEMDSVRVVPAGTYALEATFSLHGKPVFAYRAVRSTDGKTLTIASVNPVSRATLNSVVVYHADQP
ncbi:MAG TPA: hypothetical protein VGI83_04685 [Gemmatimonadales bacterium]